MAIILKPENVAQFVFFVRGEKAILDADLARLYGVTTGNLNKAVKRNQVRFPGDFMFQLNEKETESLIFQSGRSKGRGGRRHRPYAFTEQGALQPAINIVRSDVHGHHHVEFDVKCGSQIGFDLRRINSAAVPGRELVYFVRSQSRIKRILLKDFPSAARGVLLAW